MIIKKFQFFQTNFDAPKVNVLLISLLILINRQMLNEKRIWNHLVTLPEKISTEKDYSHLTRFKENFLVPLSFPPDSFQI
jgi:hypothetical protein